MLSAADLVCASPRVDLSYVPLRHETKEQTEDGAKAISDRVERYRNITLELADHPLVRPNGTAILVTHGCPATHMVKSLCHSPGGISLPSHEDIKAGNYQGPPLQYTATTALKRDHSAKGTNGAWDLAPGFKIFSNEHDPRLKEEREKKQARNSRYVYAKKSSTSSSEMTMEDFEVPKEFLGGLRGGSSAQVVHPVDNTPIEFRVPDGYKHGDRIFVLQPADE
jgi:hypothetical protein